MSQLFPAREVRPGVRRRLRRDKDGFCTFEPSSIGQFRTLRPNELFGNVPVGRFVRQLVVSIFNYLTVDILKCSPEEVSFIFFIFFFFVSNVNKCGFRLPTHGLR